RATLLETDAFGIGANLDALAAQDRFNRRRDVGIFAPDQSRPFFDYGHQAAEAAIHLGELEADIAAADDDQVPGKRFQLEDGSVGEVGDVVDTGHGWHDAATADIDENAIGADERLTDANFLRRLQARMAVENGAALHAAQPALDSVTGGGNDLVLPFLHRPQV